MRKRSIAYSKNLNFSILANLKPNLDFEMRALVVRDIGENPFQLFGKMTSRTQFPKTSFH